MKYIYMTLIYIKRHLKGGFLIALLIMPVLVLSVRYFVPQSSSSLKVGIYAEGKDHITDELVSQLLNHKGYATFILYDSEEELIRCVENKTLECAYIIPEDIADKINTLELKGAIVRGENPSSIFSRTTDEIVFSKLMRVCGYTAAVSLGEKNNLALNKDNIKNSYRSYLESDAVFSLVFEKISVNERYTAEKPDTGSVGIGLMAVYIMLGGMLGALSWYKDEKRGINIWGMGNVVATTGLMCIFALASMGLAHYDNLERQSALMVIYFIGVCGYSCLLKSVFCSSTVMCGAFPFITLACLCFCPIVFDIGLIYPALGFLGRLFIPGYYIDYINGGSINSLVIFSLICWVLYFCIEEIKYKIIKI